MLHFPRWKIVLIIVVMLLGALYAFPNVLSRQGAADLPGWLPNARMNLGLDLRGGSHLLLEVDMHAVIQERMEAVEQGLRGALRKDRIGYTNLGVANDAVHVTITNPADVAKARQALRDIEGGLAVETGEGGQMTIRYDEASLRERQRQVIGQSIEIVRRRVDEFGMTEPSIQQQGQDRILVQVPGLDNPQRLIEVIGKTARLSFRMVDLSANPETVRQTGRVPPGSELLPSDHDVDPMTGKPIEYLVQRRILVGGDNLTDAQATFQNGQPVVSFRFDTVGARRFADATRDNVGKPFAIVLDNKVISAPVIREPILGGSGIISGNFTAESAKDLALLLRAGALPAPLRVLEQRTVGPDLGADSIQAGKIACIIGYLLIAVLMTARYKMFGVIANVALLANLLLTIAIMSIIHATLTLPGIAGMVLGLAMAVDANVLIYERMREEIRMGRSPLLAADVGSQKAFITILDSNLTTLCAAFFLYLFGSGPVKGFAVTLSIGLICSMFTAVTLTRALMAAYLKLTKPKTITI
jgi:preprotein translocase subunit SecD